MLGNLKDFDHSFTNQVRALINAKVRDYIGQRGNTIKRLSEACHVSGDRHLAHSTVSKLAYYETTRPTWATVIAVAEALDLLEDIGHLLVEYGRKHRRNLPKGAVPIRREKSR